MDDRLERLSEKAKGLPKAPGVYLMKDDKGRVIYVGKIASLRDRVGSYFQPATKLEYKKAPLRDLVVDFDVIQTDDEVEALLAENRLIKDIQPKFNARLLDDKTFPYLMITTGEEFPGVYVTREPRKEGVKLYGPFTSRPLAEGSGDAAAKGVQVSHLPSGDSLRRSEPAIFPALPALSDQAMHGAVCRQDRQAAVSRGHQHADSISRRRQAEDSRGDEQGDDRSVEGSALRARREAAR